MANLLPAVINRDELTGLLTGMALSLEMAPIMQENDYTRGYSDGHRAAIIQLSVALGVKIDLPKTQIIYLKEGT